MKIAIYGAGSCGEYIIQEINSTPISKVEIEVIIDNNPCFSGRTKYNLPIVGLEKFIDIYQNIVECVLVTAWDTLQAQEMAVSLLNKNYNNIYLLPENMCGGRLPLLTQDGKFMSYVKHISFVKPVLPYAEYHVSDFCNLKCKRCGHFSNLVTEKIFPDIREFKDVLDELSKKFRNIKRFRLMGGEPFVNPDLGLFIYEVKRVFPYSDIRVVSNGLLLPNISDRTVEAIKACGAVIDVSQYPPTRHMIEKIITFVQEKKLKIAIGEKITKFMVQKGLDTTEDFERIWTNCFSKACHFLRGRRLYPCPAVILFYENKEFLELNITEEETYKHSFDLNNGNEDGWEILKKFLCPFDFCKYCTDMEWFDWSVSKDAVKKEDWFAGLNSYNKCSKLTEKNQRE